MATQLSPALLAQLRAVTGLERSPTSNGLEQAFASYHLAPGSLPVPCSLQLRLVLGLIDDGDLHEDRILASRDTSQYSELGMIAYSLIPRILASLR